MDDLQSTIKIPMEQAKRLIAEWLTANYPITITPDQVEVDSDYDCHYGFKVTIPYKPKPEAAR